MKLFAAFGLLVVLVLAAVTFVAQSVLFLAFACDAGETRKKKRIPDWFRQALVGGVATFLLIGVSVPPVLFYFDSTWSTIGRVVLIGFGVSAFFVVAAVMRILK